MSSEHYEPDELDQVEALELTGEEGGEHVEGGSDDPFFVSKQAAVFKHKLLSTYFPKFAGKAGSTEADKRLVYVDTHAGRGVYDDGTDGSPLLIATSAAGMVGRRTDCLFIERKRSNHQRLQQVLHDRIGPRLNWEAVLGPAADHIDHVLEFAGDSPLFMFVDPYGLGPSFENVVRILNRPRRGFGSKTELLLNFISGAFGRAGAAANPAKDIRNREQTLQHLDVVLGGRYWRYIYLQAGSPSEAVEAMAVEYARRINARTGCTWTAIPVKNREHHVPLYWLVHFTRHPDGQWRIREAADQASAKWREFCNAPPQPTELALFQPAEVDPFPAEEAKRQASWVDHIEANARTLLLRNGSIRLPDDAEALFGDALGLAWAKHLRKALARLWKQGILAPRPYAEGIEKYTGSVTQSAPGP